MFRTNLGQNVFDAKYAIVEGETWPERARQIVDYVVGTAGGKEHPLMSDSERQQLFEYIRDFKFLPGGRYIYYAGRGLRAFNNCYLLRGEEDTREEWANICHRSMSCLSTGGGIGVDYSVFRSAGTPLRRTGGKASGPIPLAHAVNEIGRQVMQGGSRRSAIYASLNHRHGDIERFLEAKDWSKLSIGQTGLTVADLKEQDFNYPAPFDMTNISVNYDNAWRDGERLSEVFMRNVRGAMQNGEPGFSFNFDAKENETLRNACTEVTSEDDSDVCNLGSVNFSRIETVEELAEVTALAAKFLVCGTIRADLPYEKVRTVREKNRRLGLGIMGLHEWLLKRGYRYEPNEELDEWLEQWQYSGIKAANEHCDRFYLNRPIAYFAIAPTGTIGIIAGTTTGIEPVYAVAYKRRYLIDGTRWHAEYMVDATAQTLIDQGINPEEIETAVDLAADPERRIRMQAFVQKYVDQAISSTLNLPAWGSGLNNEDRVEEFAGIIAKYAPKLRGLTCYPDGGRGGQPIVPVSYEEAEANKNVIIEENDSCKGGVCGV